MPTRVLKGTTNGISRKMVIDRICLIDNGGPLLSEMPWQYFMNKAMNTLKSHSQYVFVVPKSSRVKSRIGWNGRGPRIPRGMSKLVVLSSGKLRFCTVQWFAGQNERRRSRVWSCRNNDTQTRSKCGHTMLFTTWLSTGSLMVLANWFGCSAKR